MDIQPCRQKWKGTEELSPGKHTLEFDFKYDGLGAATLAFGSPSGLGRSGTGTLKVDGCRRECAICRPESSEALHTSPQRNSIPANAGPASARFPV